MRVGLSFGAWTFGTAFFLLVLVGNQIDGDSGTRIVTVITVGLLSGTFTLLRVLGGERFRQFHSIGLNRDRTKVLASTHSEWPKESQTVDEFRTYITTSEKLHRERWRDELLHEFTGEVAANQSNYITRIHRHVVFEQGFQKVSVNIGYAIPSAYATILPVLLVRKGEMLDSLEVKVNGNNTSAIGYREAAGITSLILRKLFLECFHKDSQSERVFETISYATDPNTSSEKSNIHSISGRLIALRNCQVARYTQPKEGDINQLINLISQLTSGYFLFVPLKGESDSTSGAHPRTARPTVTCSYLTRVPMTSKERGWLYSIRSTIRGVLVMTKRWHEIELPEVEWTRSFHLTLDAPEEMYVHFARVVTVGKKPEHLLNACETDTRPRINISDTLGLQHVHAYLRDCHRPFVSTNGTLFPWKSLRLFVEFRDRPPGIVLSILLASTTMTVLLGAVCINIDSLGPASLSSGASAVLLTPILGIPVVLAGWIMTRIDAGNLRRMSFPSLFSVAGFLSICACFILVGAVPLLRYSETRQDIIGFDIHLLIPGPGAVWVILLAASIAHLLHCFFIWSARTLRYSDRLHQNGNNKTMLL